MNAGWDSLCRVIICPSLLRLSHFSLESPGTGLEQFVTNHKLPLHGEGKKTGEEGGTSSSELHKTFGEWPPDLSWAGPGDSSCQPNQAPHQVLPPMSPFPYLKIFVKHSF